MLVEGELMGDDTVKERKKDMEWVEASGEGQGSMPIRIKG